MNPAVVNLLKAHAAARLRRVTRGFTSPRRILLSLFVVVLALVWIGQTLASMLLREAFDPEAFRRWVSLPLMAYFFWHLMRVAWQRPEDAIEWSPEEEALVVGGPFTTLDKLAYRFGVIFTATVPKAMLTTLALWPDLSWFGPLTLLLALVFLELFRMVTDLATSCLSKRGYLSYRLCVASATAGLAWLGYLRGMELLAATGIENSVAVPVSQQAALILQAIRHSPVVAFVEAPFLTVADVIAGRGSLLSIAGKLAGLLTSIVLASWVIVELYSLHEKLSRQKDRQLWESSGLNPQVNQPREGLSESLPAGILMSVFGPLVWRQCKRAKRYAGSLLVSMGIPAMLSCLPLFSVPNPVVAFVAVVCGLLFYTFVLLPEAIKFDFRLDMDHLCHLKMLPMSSRRIVFCQLATPVVLALMFQVAVILFAGIYRGVNVNLILGAIAVTSPLTVVFVALDNLVFLLYPHRPTQEGFEAFIRTILKFTGKSLLLVLTGAVLVFWAPMAAAIAGQLAAISTATVFYAGISLGVAAVACIIVRLVITAYDRFDISLDAVS